eukprot:10161828-Alexandrium_andersonii.AAC.1
MGGMAGTPTRHASSRLRERRCSSRAASAAAAATRDAVLARAARRSARMRRLPGPSGWAQGWLQRPSPM